MATVEVKVPDIGDFDEVAVIEVLVKVGDTVKAEQSLITVESDKASMEIPSSQAGVVKELKKVEGGGGKVKEGSCELLEGEGCGFCRAWLPPRLRHQQQQRPLPRRRPQRRRPLHRPVRSRSRCRTSATSRTSR